jgi:prevent-host-death family protein
MKQVGVFDAKTHLSELIDDGVSVTITKHGKPVAVLTPVRENPEAVIARIRAMRVGGAPLTMKTIVDTTHSGRR